MQAINKKWCYLFSNCS